jgi:hypothetical protein
MLSIYAYLFKSIQCSRKSPNLLFVQTSSYWLALRFALVCVTCSWGHSGPSWNFWPAGYDWWSTARQSWMIPRFLIHWGCAFSCSSRVVYTNSWVDFPVFSCSSVRLWLRHKLKHSARPPCCLAWSAPTVKGQSSLSMPGLKGWNRLCLQRSSSFMMWRKDGSPFAAWPYLYVFGCFWSDFVYHFLFSLVALVWS